MKKCPNCGTLNNNNAKFCVNCGHDFSKVSQRQERLQPQATSFREQFDNNTNINKQSNQPNYRKNAHNSLFNIKNNSGNNGKRPWFKSLDGALAAVAILLIIIAIELGFAITYLSDIDNNVGASHNQDQSYIIQHHQHKIPKLYTNYHKVNI